MIKAVIFDNVCFNETFASDLAKSGVKVSCVLDSCLPLSEAIVKTALSLDCYVEESLFVTSDSDNISSGRRSGCFCAFVGKADDENALSLKGLDFVIESLSSLKGVDLTAFVEDQRRAFYDRTIAGALIRDALSVMNNAYAKYSDFKVGAALYTDKGNVYKGCNVENASFGGTICAERGAAMACIANEGASSILAIAIASDAEEPAPPCAICRQFLSEFMAPSAQLYLISRKSGVLRHYDFEKLLPMSFTEF